MGIEGVIFVIFIPLIRNEMCTVSLTSLPGPENHFVLTSNRDEAMVRKTLAPAEYREKGVRVVFPKDELAGGTWIGVSEKKRAICLLNGAFEKHVRKPPYKKSRGVVVRELLAAPEILPALKEYDLIDIEPFTCVLVDWKLELKFFEFVWDGGKKHLKHLDHGSYIWSSSLLYSKEVQMERKEKFEAFKAEKTMDAENLLRFHSAGINGEDLIINRGSLKTCSITQISKTGEEVVMFYKDLLEEKDPFILRFS